MNKKINWWWPIFFFVMGLILAWGITDLIRH
jgi:hypothetical protein